LTDHNSNIWSSVVDPSGSELHVRHDGEKTPALSVTRQTLHSLLPAGRRSVLTTVMGTVVSVSSRRTNGARKKARAGKEPGATFMGRSGGMNKPSEGEAAGSSISSRGARGRARERVAIAARRQVVDFIFESLVRSRGDGIIWSRGDFCSERRDL